MPRKKKPPLDAASRERIDRFMQRHPPPIPLPVLDPSDIRFRLWVIHLTQDALHQEVCRRLKERWTFVRDALIAWPHEYLDDKEARFPTLIQFLERITIDSPTIGSAEAGFPMLKYRLLPPVRLDPEIPRFLRILQTDDEGGPPDPMKWAGLAFEDRLLGAGRFRPSPYENLSANEYDRLLKALREVKTGPR